MTMQSVCHGGARSAFIGIAALCTAPWVFTEAARADPKQHDYPTIARIEYVHECMARHGGQHSRMYQCACVIDRIAGELSYDDFVEATTFTRYKSLPGEGGAIFRDSEHARRMAELLEAAEGKAHRACGLPQPEE